MKKNNEMWQIMDDELSKIYDGSIKEMKQCMAFLNS